MHFFYPSAPERSDSQINIWRLNGTKQYLKHYDNLLFLHRSAREAPGIHAGEG